jgi:hypothetical protein
MKLIKNIVILVFISSIFAACSDSDDPVIINEEELITTVRATLIPEGGDTEVILESVDLDGDGPNDPVLTVSGAFNPNTTYAGTLKILNEAESPADSNGNPVGVQFNLLTGAAGTGGFTVILRHEPEKSADNVNTGDVTNAGGSTDVQVTFNITVN